MMTKALVKLVYRQVIDASSTGTFERSVFDITYREYLLRSREYDREERYKTFTELKASEGSANSLHYKISFAAGNLVEGLKHRMPDLVDNLGNCITFDAAKFELIESDRTDKSAHKLAISYVTETLTLFNVMGDHMLLSKGHDLVFGPVETYVLKLQPNLSIIEYQQLDRYITNTYVPIHTHHN